MLLDLLSISSSFLPLFQLQNLYNEDRNLLRIKERERRNQEIHLDKESFLENAPLFGEPYKTSKGDELSSRIQNMLGNFDELEDVISNQSHQDFSCIPKRAVPLSQEKNECLRGPKRSNSSLQPSSHGGNPRSVGPRSTASSTGDCSSQKNTAVIEQNSQSFSHNTKSYNLFHNRSQNKDNCLSGRDDQQVKADNCTKVQLSHLQHFQPLLPLSSLIQPLSPITPLSPLHSSGFTNSKLQQGSKDCPPAKSPREQDVHSGDPENLSSELNVPVPSQHASQTFPPSLPSKPNMIQQKPTAYVRPMDGQDQAPSKSPELKLPSEEYSEEPYGNIAAMKASARAKLSKLKIPSRPVEETLSNEANCVEEILKEMTQSWPPPLTAIQTPSTTESSKFPFQNKDTQHVPSGFVGHKKPEILPKDSRGENSMLEKDLQISSSDDSDGDQVMEKSVPNSVPESASSLSQSDEVVSRHSSGELNNLSESENSSGSDTESESSSSDSEGTSRAPTPEPDPSPANKWQLNNWINPSQPPMPSDGDSELLNGHNSQDSQAAETKEGHECTGSSTEKTTRDVSLNRSKHQNTPALHDSNTQQQTVSKKQSSKPVKTLVPEANHEVKVESKPCTHGDKDQPSTGQAKVKIKVGHRPSEKRQSDSSARISSERKKHKGLIQNAPKSKQFIDRDSLSTDQLSNTDEPSSCCSLPPAASVPQKQLYVENGADIHKPAREESRTTFRKSAATEVKNVNKSNIRKPVMDAKEVNRTTLLHPANEVREETRTSIEKSDSQVREEIRSNINKPAGKVKEENRSSTSKATPKENRTKLSKPVNQVNDYVFTDQALPASRVEDWLPPVSETKVHWPLVVKIDLSLLSRIPSSCSKERQQSKSCIMECAGQKNREELQESKVKRKHMVDMEASESKKQRLDKENKLSSSSHKESSHKRVSKSSSEKENPFLLPLPSPVQKPAKVAHKRHNSGSSTSSQVSNTSANDTKDSSSKKNSSSSSLSSKHKRTTDRQSGHSKNKGTASNTTPEQSLPNGNSKPTRPLLKFDDKNYPVEHHLQEAKKVKHKADVMLDKIGKAFNYLDAALSFVESGIAMESEAQPPKSSYTMFSETVDLIKYIMKLKNFTDSSATNIEKIFVVLCIRCQSLLFMAMFRFKKDTALKYSRTLNEHFKSSSRTTQAPSPCVARGTGTPSPLSQTPSPASSGGSQPGSSTSNGGNVAIPHMIHQLASTYVSITSIFLHGHELWEQADALAKKNKEFFTELDAAVGLLSLTSSMTELVHYTRQGLHWLRLDTKLL
ncbi:AF4/FMR2 family member 1-like isoform X2 [Scyliorhinus canicula]|uniref:AF4/FMR2 family member 1-like isoform X2 n=1 Tax=Scyliorhinus canicula TaxID=7830 RepID=UPI0018F7BE4B|nr:AF4/FMR2 family member 1-like isoform X2 [Scyliorhinus canicula]